MASLDKDQHYLNGQLLIAMPGMRDPRFDKAVIYICAHDERGAMGIIVNHLLADLEFGSLLKDLEIQSNITLPDSIKYMPVLYGGPVEVARGFLVHSNDFEETDTIKVQNDIYVTGTVDALISLTEKKIPDNLMFALGYAGWDSGQLEKEMMENAWLNVPAKKDLVFQSDKNTIWDLALKEIGITADKLSSLSGSA